MSKPRRDGFPFAKTTAALAVTLVIGFGLCAVDGAFLNKFRDADQEFGPNTIVSVIGGFVMLFSMVGLLLTLIGWALAGISGKLGQDSEPQRLFDDMDKDPKS